MAYALSGIPYILYVIGALVLAALYSQRAKLPNQPIVWRASRIFLVVVQLFLALDNFRVALGATDAWRDAYLAEEQPFGADLILPLSAVHVIVVPLILFPLTELAIAVRTKLDMPTAKVVKTKGQKIARVVMGIISLLVCAFGCYYFYVEVYNTSVYGLQPIYNTEVNNVKFIPPNKTVIEEVNAVEGDGTLITPIGSSLVGVIVFSFTSIGVGVYMAWKLKWPVLAVTSTVVLVGQGIGPMFPTYAFYAANFLELLSFFGIYLADRKVFNLAPEDDEESLTNLSKE